MRQYQLFPDLAPDEFAALKADIQARGVRVPVEFDEAGNVLDGHHRIRACEELGIKDFPFIARYGLTEAQKRDYIRSLNLKRRHLATPQKRDIIADALKDHPKRGNRIHAVELGIDHKTVASVRQELEATGEIPQLDRTLGADGKERPATRPTPKEDTAPEELPGLEPERLEPFDDVKAYGHGEHEREAVKQPGVVEAIVSGGFSLVKEAEAKDWKETKKAEREADLERQRAAILANPPAEPPHEFPVIVVDPPWPAGWKYDPVNFHGALPYPEMSLSEIAALELPACDDAVLFLWTTHQFLERAFEVMEAWGWGCKANLVWDKETMGTGMWYRRQCEFCLFGVKGKPRWDNTKWRDIIREPRREHSRKPKKFYEMVETLTAGPWAEYFAREQRPGWWTYGNDTEKFETPLVRAS